MILLNSTPLVNKVLTSSGIDELISISHDFEAVCEDLNAAGSE